MGFGIGTMIYVTLLLTNAIAVLNEERFLARIGWTSITPHQQPANNMYHTPYDATSTDYRQNVGMKTQIVNLIGAIRTVMRFPLIFLNIAVILYSLVF